ncbi:integrase [Pseudomonas khavaziana]|uniref:integrase n=1 Tax=Pseudomonas khavaziana TaxID=2842351 RepID=UPI001C3D69D5|nr:integrase [Pseudomonas khavaziana]MBV4482897.1 integrase [Pseudomonas khavaziana]
MSAVIRSVGSLFASGHFSDVSEPDSALQMYAKPSPDFILCRDEEGNSTAVYGEIVWDFNPYRLSARKINKIYFQAIFEQGGIEQQELIEEVKYVLYCLIYFAGGGRRGSLSASTLAQYWMVLRMAMKFCYAQRQKPLVGVLTLKQLFTVPVYFAAFIRDQNPVGKVLNGILRALIYVGADRLGYAVLNPITFGSKAPDSKQHPVIPTRLYLNLINITGDLVDQIHPGADRVEAFLGCFTNKHYGRTHSRQKRDLGYTADFQPDMAQVLKDHDLHEVFSGEYECTSKRHLQTALLKMQYALATVVHLYTGMRDQEVMRMSYLCLSDQVVRAAVVDDLDIRRDKAQLVDVLSTTTKFSGYKKESVWLAPGEVVRAIAIAKAICRGLAKLYNIPLDDRCPLFLNPSILSFTQSKAEVGVTSFTARATQGSVLRTMLIQAEDFQELAQSDPNRDFQNDPGFAIGQPWPLTTHQFRRSLAFYGSSSGFLSLPTLRTQFKHMTIQMARYYANNFENLRTVFGYYDEKMKEFLLPHNHFAFEYQMAMPMAVANQLISDLLFTEEPLFGGTGSYMEKQKKRISDGEIHIEDLRSDTEKRVKNGAISYRSTILGGCTKAGRCDALLLGEYTECLSCDASVIKPSMLDAAIEDATSEIKNYAKNSAEFQILKGDLELMMVFKARHIETVEL